MIYYNMYFISNKQRKSDDIEREIWIKKRYVISLASKISVGIYRLISQKETEKVRRY